ncbi:MAG TPA: UDP-N-acetylmuramate dehydrogenase [Spongiibacteraceae bacterium]|nr:UDP-N-acetylmuramate dehydrogenase [Spongiibacteraceae bacterium]
MIVNLREHVDLQPLNTLALPARARYFCRVASIEEIEAAVQWARARQLPLLVLGGGSNVVLRGEWPGLVLQIALLGKTLEDIGGGARITVAAGENWHELVQWTLQQRVYGLENLTLIPGTVGAAPIQNIGAYGVELADFLECVRGFSLTENRSIELSAADCRLGYRDSIFKNALRGNFIVAEIVLRLRRDFAPVLSYPALHALRDIENLTAQRVESTVRELRQSKLPDPAQLPNAGSFFKNPVLDAAHFAQLQSAYPTLPSFAATSGVKIPAAWLVEHSGWKGRRHGQVGVHSQQAIVLVNFAGASADSAVGAELLELAALIQADVLRKFAVTLELEPTVYGDTPG